MRFSINKNGFKLLSERHSPLKRQEPPVYFGSRIDLENKIFARAWIFSVMSGNPITLYLKKFRLSVKRREIKGFSYKSCRRFQDLLLSAYVPGCEYIAMTLTLPVEVSVDEWYLLVKRFRQNILRKNKSCIWRVELQRRKVPHFHLVGFGNDINDISDYWESWVKAVDGLSDCVSVHEGFLLYGFVAKFVRGQNWVKYMALHVSKHKRSQLGWKGRQWGVMGGERIKYESPVEFSMDDDVSIKVCRVLRRQFGLKTTADFKGSKRLFSSPDFIRRLVDFYSETPF